VPDRLYFSCRIRGLSGSGLNQDKLLRQFAKMLAAFPFSKLAKRGPVLRVYAVERVEPPLTESEFPPATEPDVMLQAAHEFIQPDCAIEIDTYWDLWQFAGDWKLQPAPITLACFGPEFDIENPAHDRQDHLRIEFGTDALFLPAPNIEGGLRMGQSNLKSLLRLVGDLERTLDLETRQVWSESGAIFADML
jgi:hypothetical protein